MAGNKRVVRLMSSGYPLEVNTKMQRSDDDVDETTEFTYSLGKTYVTMKLTKKFCSSGGVKQVYIDLLEDSGKGSLANLSLQITENKRYGILCNYMNTTFMGSYSSVKNYFYAPPLPEREVVHYFCPESGSGGCFTLEKKKDRYDTTVVRVKATHDFIVGEETMHVKVKIRYDGDGKEKRLNVEVEEPVKVTTEYTKRVVSRLERKMSSAIEASNDAVYTDRKSDAVYTGRKSVQMRVRNLSAHTNTDG